MDYAQFLEPGGTREELIVCLHGYRNRSQRLQEVRDVLRAGKPNADIFAPLLPTAAGFWRCVQKAETIVAALIEAIDGFVQARDTTRAGYQSITLIGHSFGAVLARKILVIAYGEQADAKGRVATPFEPEFDRYKAGLAWAPKIRRMVLLAGMNRGWTVTSAMDWTTSVAWSFGQLVGEISDMLGHPRTVFAIRRGAPFLVNTRLQWLALMNPDFGHRPELMAVQLLGTRDELVAPDDNVDFSVDQFGDAPHEDHKDDAPAAQPGKSYFYLDVPNSDHDSIIDVAETAANVPGGDAQDREARAGRRELLMLAVAGRRDELVARGVPRARMADVLPSAPNFEVTDVVFVIHGIRDKGFWTQKVAGTIKRLAPPGRFSSCTATYGYFAMLPFFIGSVRQRKVEWLMDQYVEVRARYPRANFHYVGHSNGTYLAAKALQDYPAARFDHVVFAGSVVRRDYDWLRLIDPASRGSTRSPQVKKVLNYVATRDWVVALFPKAVQRLRIFNLGSAGHDGFCQASPGGPVYETRYIVGKHGAGHQEPHWEGIARFIITGVPPQQTFPPLSKTQSWWLCLAGPVSGVLFAAVLSLALYLGALLIYSVFGASSAVAAGAIAILCFLYFWIVYLFVTRW